MPVPHTRRIGRPVALDVVPQPKPHPPLGLLAGDELFGLTHAERVTAAARAGWRRRRLTAPLLDPAAVAALSAPERVA